MLKQLRLRSERRSLQMQLDALHEKHEALDARQRQAETALDEAQTEEDFALVRAELDAIEAELREAGLPQAEHELNGQLTQIDNQLRELDERAQQDGGTPPAPDAQEREEHLHMNRYQVREMLKTGAYYERAEVKEFYDRFRQLRAVTGQALTIPNVVVSRIFDMMGDYTTLYPLVDTIRASGTVRILLDTDTTPATWLEQTGKLPEGDVGTITNVDFDGFKVGKVTFVDNCMLQDSIINLDDYVTRKLARSIAMALDKAIAAGKGSASKEPDGIIPKLSSTHKVTVTAPTGYYDLVKPISLIDTGEDTCGEIVAVMNRKTYYNRCLQYSVQTTAAGEVVAKLPNLHQPDLLGLRVVFNNNIPDDAILYGDFSKYTLVERESLTLKSSEHVKFQEDQMAYLGLGRFDGKPTKPDAFVLVTIADGEV